MRFEGGYSVLRCGYIDISVGLVCVIAGYTLGRLRCSEVFHHAGASQHGDFGCPSVFMWSVVSNDDCQA